MTVRASDSLTKLAPALIRAQAACAAPIKDAENPHFRSKYADLEAVRGAMFSAFAAEGLVVLQMPGYENGCATLTNRLLHTSGEWIEWDAASPVAKQDPQGWRGAITYIRRTCLEGIGNLAAEDDDGNTASQPPKPKGSLKPATTTERLVMLNAKQKGWFYTKAQGDQNLVHRCVATVTGKSCTTDEWPAISADEHAMISTAIDVAIKATEKAGGAT